jgi:uracil-DNA glycosylase
MHRAQQQLIQLYEQFDTDPPECIRELASYGSSRFVPGDGSLVPRAIFIGEAPGAQEDRQGSPFVGRSGKLLDILLRAALLDRDSVWITNVVKYRPDQNRTPEPNEIAASLPLLRREVALVAGDHCRAIVALGRTAASALARRSISVGREHGNWVALRGNWRMFVSYHPAAGLRNQNVADSMLLDFVRLGRDLQEMRDR